MTTVCITRSLGRIPQNTDDDDSFSCSTVVSNASTVKLSNRSTDMQRPQIIMADKRNKKNNRLEETLKWLRGMGEVEAFELMGKVLTDTMSKHDLEKPSVIELLACLIRKTLPFFVIEKKGKTAEEGCSAELEREQSFEVEETLKWLRGMTEKEAFEMIGRAISNTLSKHDLEKPSVIELLVCLIRKAQHVLMYGEKEKTAEEVCPAKLERKQGFEGDQCAHAKIAKQGSVCDQSILSIETKECNKVSEDVQLELLQDHLKDGNVGNNEELSYCPKCLMQEDLNSCSSSKLSNLVQSSLSSVGTYDAV